MRSASLSLLKEAEGSSARAGQDGLGLLQSVALGPAVLLPDLEVDRDVVAGRGDVLKEGDGVVQDTLLVRALGLRLGDRLLGIADLLLEVGLLALEQRGGCRGLGLERLELSDRVVLLLSRHGDVLVDVLLNQAEDALDTVALALGSAVGLGPGLGWRRGGRTGAHLGLLDQGKAV